MTSRRVAIATLGLAVITAGLCAAIWLPGYPKGRLQPGAGGSVVMTDRRGEVLRVLPAAGGGRGRWVPLSEVPPLAIVATLAGEDRRFFQHHGVDLRAVVRATGSWLRHGRVVSGASTLTMQLARTLEPHAPAHARSLGGKLREVVHALRLERALDKHALLEQYLNRVNYGAGALGIEAAAWRFFGKSAAALHAGEATLLAVLPRAPRLYDLRDEAGRARALARRNHVLAAMEAAGNISASERAAIVAMPVQPSTQGQAAVANREAPHFTDWVLTRRRDEQRDATPTATLQTTLDLNLQRRIERGFRRHVDAQPEGAPVDAGLVVLDPSTGAVLAMIGAPDYAAPEMGQLNITTTARHPGSALKPFLYALALEDGATPASLANDSLAAVPGYHPGKRPRERGPARYREALAGSYNLAALDVLEAVKPGRLLERLRVAGLGPLPGTGSDYGLSLALGAGRVRLVDLAAAYGAFVTGGLVTAPRATTREPTLTTRVFSREVSWLVLDMLADGGARRAAFGATLPFDLPFPVAAKTGTSSGFADTLAIAATREVVVAAWAGSFDGSGTRGRLAMWSAAPLVRLALLAAAEDHGGRLELPPPPEGIVTGDVCTVTGQRAGAACPHKREWFVRGTVPAELCPRHPE